jgi:hypothetical protein
MAIASGTRGQQQTATSKYTKQYTRRNSPLRALVYSPSTSKAGEICSGCYSLSTVLSLLVFFTWLDPEFVCLGKFRHQLPQNSQIHSPVNSALAHGPPHHNKTSNSSRPRWHQSKSTSQLPSMGATGPASCLTWPTSVSRCRTASSPPSPLLSSASLLSPVPKAMP